MYTSYTHNGTHTMLQQYILIANSEIVVIASRYAYAYKYQV